MEGGALGVDGADAAEPVGKDHRSKNANVTVQGHKMEGGNVKDSVSSHGNVKLGIAPVSSLPYIKSFKRLNYLKKKKKKKQVRESEKSKLVDIDFHRFFFLREKLKVADVNFLFHEKMNLTVVLLMIKRLLIISMILMLCQTGIRGVYRRFKS